MTPYINKPKRYPRLLLLVTTIALALLALLALAFWSVFLLLGRTPQELLDHAENRLQGHPKLERIAHPVIGLFRETLNAPTVNQREQQQFIVPPPPPLKLEALRAGDDSWGEGRSDSRVLRVIPGSAIPSINIASKLAKDGDIVEISAGEYRADVAVWMQKQLTIRGVGGNARLYADGASAEGKAIWVFRNGEFTIENIDFIGAKVRDKNGAGIRFEQGRMVVRNCLFYGNESGLLTANQENTELIIENSEFGYNGIGDGQTHNLYVGNIRQLKVSGSYFHHAYAGHLLKSRASRNIITYNRFSDEMDGRSSYELEFPIGGFSLVMGNIIQQSRQTENSTVISFGAEGYLYPQNTLYLINNTILNEHLSGGAFLRVAPGNTQVISRNNLLVGEGKYHVPGKLDSFNDIFAEWDVFVLPQRQNYTLNETGRKLRAIEKPDPRIADNSLLPTHEYVHPRQTMPLNGPRLYPGAVQQMEAN
jgi:hypothetical protein